MNVRWLPYEVADGPHNMAADDVLLQSAVDHQIASLRFYGWSAATLSLGYFESAATHRSDSRLTNLPWVRRPTGGGTLVHDQEVTYALALHPHSLGQVRDQWISRMHSIIYAALFGLGVKGLGVVMDMRPSGAGLCFEQHTHGDVLCRGSKIVGSAQRKHRRALLQHGGILLAQSPSTPALPGLRELASVTLTAPQVEQAVADEFMKATRWTLTRCDWTTDERRRIELFAQEKYSASAWNNKR